MADIPAKLHLHSPNPNSSGDGQILLVSGTPLVIVFRFSVALLVSSFVIRLRPDAIGINYPLQRFTIVTMIFIEP